MKMTTCKLQGVDGEVRMTRGRLESRERLPSLKMLGAGRGCLGGGGLRGGQVDAFSISDNCSTESEDNAVV